MIEARTESAPEPDRLARAAAMLRRRAAEIAYTTVILALLSVITAMSIPPTYRSSATVVAQAEEIAPDLARGTLAEVARERIAVISQEVLTRTALLALIDKYDLYGAERRIESTEEILARMRRHISVTTSGAKLADRPGSALVNAVIPFEIAFESRSPLAAQRVAAELVSLYLNDRIAESAGSTVVAQLDAPAESTGFDAPAGTGPRVREGREAARPAEERAAPRFALIDPPQLPERPASPNRPVILLLGFLLSAVGGVGFGALRERFDRTIHSANEVARIVSAPVLGVVPYVEGAAGAPHRSTLGQSQALWLAVAGLLVMLALFVHYFVIELPSLWYIAREHLGF